MHLLVLIRLRNVKTRDKLHPLLNSEYVHSVTLVRHASVEIQSDKLTQIIHDSGIREEVAKPKLLEQIKNVWLSFHNGLRIARRENPQVIVAFNLVPYGLIALLIARQTGTKAIVSLIGSDFNIRIRLPLFGTMLRAILRSFDRVAIFGEDARAKLIDYGLNADRVFVLPNTADTDTYKPDPTVIPDVDLVYVGYLTPLKRVDLVLHTLRKIHETRPETTLLIVGDGETRDDLEALANALGVRQAVTFHGWTDSTVEQLRRARLFIFLSEYEGLPMAVIEAMCTGLPVVVTDVGAINTVVRDGENGYLLPSPADPSLAAERILRLLQDREHYHQLREAALKVSKHYGYERATHIWDEVLSGLYPSVIETRPSP